MPEMGESVTEGTVLEYHVAVGDTVEEGDTIVEVSTDKVDAEVPSPAVGTITELLKSEDDTVKVGEALAKMQTGRAGRSARTDSGDNGSRRLRPRPAPTAEIDSSGRATPLARRAGRRQGDQPRAA